MVSVLPAPARRLLAAACAAAASLVPLTAVPAVAGAALPPPVRSEDQRDHLTVVVRHAGEGRDGTYEVYCHPGAGRHPDAAGACRVLDENTRWGRDPYAPVPEGTTCTLLYGGPATARVTGTWAGRPVDASYDRRDGCQTARWDRMVPLLPRPGASA
ncbi:SSI family serine proteinase inhibitor [Streptomyces sp. NPDC017095]|uniref:SSI family serine proteinase inhibitor n=1 Tax=Streptomyces sp. NPDC017095 TaxID=3364977 RepID=UPI0037B46417